MERKSGDRERLRLRNWGMEGNRRASGIHLVPWTGFELTSERVRSRSWWNSLRGALGDLNNREERGGSSFLPLLFASALFFGLWELGNVEKTQRPQLRYGNQRVPPWGYRQQQWIRWFKYGEEDGEGCHDRFYWNTPISNAGSLGGEEMGVLWFVSIASTVIHKSQRVLNYI